MSEATETLQPKPEPAFTLELGANGGTLAPTSLEDLIQWLLPEIDWWAWCDEHSDGRTRSAVAVQAVRSLVAAKDAASTAGQLGWTSERASGHLDNAKQHVAEVFLRLGFPHSSSVKAKRIAAFRAKAGDRAAAFYVNAHFCEEAHGGHNLQVADAQSWHGTLRGLSDRYEFGDAVTEERRKGAEDALRLLAVKAEKHIGDTTLERDRLVRESVAALNSIESAQESQSSLFVTAQGDRERRFNELVGQHESKMGNLEAVFKEKIALRAPADYWTKKQEGHRKWARVTGLAAFGGIAVASALLAKGASILLDGTAPGAWPEAWRLTTLVLFGVFSVWALRLIVRAFLSHLHLASDAGERVVMVQTYLALMEGNQLAEAEDRKLILQALFRPASDGIVKDEAVPMSMFELVTRK